MSRLASNIFAVFAPAQTSAVNAPSRHEVTAAAPESLLELSLAEHLLLPVAIFVISLLTIDLSHLSNFIGTLWPSNAIILAALLRHTRSLSSYASIFAGGAAAIALAVLVTGSSSMLS